MGSVTRVAAIRAPFRLVADARPARAADTIGRMDLTMRPRNTLPWIALVASLLVQSAIAQGQPRCVSPDPVVVQTRDRALEQFPRGTVSLASIDVANTSGPAGEQFADPNVGYVIADRMVRELAPMALDHVGERALANRLRALAPVRSQETAWRAQDAAEDVANTIARRRGHVRWSQPWGAAVEVTVEGAALAGYAANPGTIALRMYVLTIASGLGATQRVGLPVAAVQALAERMLQAMVSAARCQ